MKNKTYPLLDVVAAMFASVEFQEKLVREINFNYDCSKYKPTEVFFVPPSDYSKPKFETTPKKGINVPSIRDYAKVTIGTDNKWINDKACVVPVTDEHREAAKEAIEAINNKVMMDVLKGATVNSFMNNLAKLLTLNEVADRDFGLLAWVPKIALRHQEIAEIDEKKAQFMGSKAIGVVGDKVFLNVTIFNIRSMPQYESILCEGHDDNGNLITFFKNEASKFQFEVNKTYEINARIKDVGGNDYSYGAIVNTLNYVRLMK